MSRLRREEAARRRHRRGLLFGAAADSAAYPDKPKVQILLANGTWLDISTDVRYQARIVVRRGRSARDRRTRAGSAAFQLDNNAGKYSPRNPLSPLYGLISRNTQVIISNRGTVRFWGEIPEWPSTWTRGSKDAVVTIQAAGWLRRLTAPNQRVLASTLRRTVGNAGPTAWWMLDDGDTATTAGSAVSGGQPLLPIFGGVRFGTTNDLGGSSVEPTFDVQNPTTLLYGGLQGVVPAMTSSWGIEVAVKSAASETNSLLVITLSNGNTVILYPQANISLLGVQVAMYNSNGISTSLGTLAEADLLGNFDANTWHYYAVYFQQSGSNVVCQLYVDGALSGTTAPFAATLASPVSFQANINIASAFPLNGSNGGDGTLKAMGSLAFFNGTTPSPGGAAYAGYTGEAAGVRVQRLCAENGVPFVAYGDLTDSEAMGPQGVDSLVGLLFDCEDADGGLLFETREQFALSYRTRNSLCNQLAAVPLDHSMPGNLDSAPRVRDDDQGVINKSTVSRRNGGSAVYELTTGPTGSADPPTGVGLYDEQPELNVSTDAQLLDIAGWRVAVGSVDELRIELVSVNVANMVTNHGLASLAGQVLAARVGDRMTLDNCPLNWVPPGQQTQLLVGQLETFDQFEHTIDFDTVQESIYHTAVLEDPILGRAESDGSYLATDLISTDVIFLVNIPSGPAWIDTATYPAEFPFDVKVGGERWTVTNITGTTSPQTWTVVRSVNGISKPQPAGTSIALAQPMILTR